MIKTKKVKPRHFNMDGKWPRGVHLYAYDEDMGMFDDSKDIMYDLHDNLFGNWDGLQRRVYLGVEIKSKSWVSWDEENRRFIEALIIDDFAADGVKVMLQRVASPRMPIRLCTKEFVWRLDLSEM